MKAVILAGGFGTRISEESHLKPKPMIEIGEQPILWHIMKIYSSFGITDFIICCGYKQHIIKEYFANYYIHNSDVTFDFSDGGRMEVHRGKADPWKVTLVDTGLNTMTGGRVKRIEEYIDGEPFLLTYGDGVSDVDIKKLIDFHKKTGKFATLTAIQPGGRFGALDITNDGTIHGFSEKKKEDGGWINGGFMVMEPAVFEYIDGDSTVLERDPLERLAAEGQLAAYQHDGYWQCMDAQKDKESLEALWASGKAPWKVWRDKVD